MIFDNSRKFNSLIHFFAFKNGKGSVSSAKQIILANVYAKYDRCDQCDHEVSSTLKEEEHISTHAQRQDAHDTKLFVFLLQAAMVTPVFFSFIFFCFLHHAYSRGLIVLHRTLHHACGCSFSTFDIS